MLEILQENWKISFENALFSKNIHFINFNFQFQIYYNAMYPNGEADVSRDVVLGDHISKLAAEITPNHRDLRVGKQYHYEAPWPSAQAELGQLAAFKTPKDKVACVVRCCQTIMNLLSLRCEYFPFYSSTETNDTSFESPDSWLLDS